MTKKDWFIAAAVLTVVPASLFFSGCAGQQTPKPGVDQNLGSLLSANDLNEGDFLLLVKTGDGSQIAGPTVVMMGKENDSCGYALKESLKQSLIDVPEDTYTYVVCMQKKESKIIGVKDFLGARTGNMTFFSELPNDLLGYSVGKTPEKALKDLYTTVKKLTREIDEALKKIPQQKTKPKKRIEADWRFPKRQFYVRRFENRTRCCISF